MSSGGILPPPPVPSSSLPTPTMPAASSTSPIAISAVVGIVVGMTSTLFTLAIVFCVIRKRSADLLPLFWKRKMFIRPPIDERPPSPPSSMRYIPSTSSLLPGSPFSHSQPPSPVVSSLNQNVETSRSRTTREVLLPTPTHSASRTYRSRGPSPLPPRHRVDVPGPALSTTGTDHSTRLTDLTQQIVSLERELEALQGMPNTLPPSERAENGVFLADLWTRVRQLKKGVERERRLANEAVPRGKW
ncbi:hypothetical protein GSI_05966 [Ganoderma sinense ZZ0214-1]|uniref:Uncharacterized protein n=1 Tax=Ganoderma sinense ZZ0214-1 TaxID=1077348 RepID=A0A2G8SCF3_9APHY|nr:hypothetical protein GSI_05966 [Ganoderma sinense ZZ0214-1]